MTVHSDARVGSCAAWLACRCGRLVSVGCQSSALLGVSSGLVALLRVALYGRGNLGRACGFARRRGAVAIASALVLERCDAIARRDPRAAAPRALQVHRPLELRNGAMDRVGRRPISSSVCFSDLLMAPSRQQTKPHEHSNRGSERVQRAWMSARGVFGGGVRCSTHMFRWCCEVRFQASTERERERGVVALRAANCCMSGAPPNDFAQLISHFFRNHPA